jgi:hypothetical protein
MSDLGQSLQERLDRARETLIPLLSSTNERTWLSDAIDERTKGFGAALLGLAAEDLIEFSIAEDAYQNFTTDIEAAWQLPSCRTVGLILQAYLRQILGYAGPPARTERSFGGDLVHALYLPYVDLWRADRRFGALVKSVRPEMTLRVVTSLTELPAAIDALH